MEKPDVNALAQRMIAAVREYVARAESSLVQRINASVAAVPAGPKGEKGDQGAQGEKGDQGERGQEGPQGAAGDRGADGASGEQGPRGESVKGDRGEPGEPGPQGKVGERGADGAPGERGPSGESIKGDAGPRGEPGARGERGEIGLQGERGVKGEAGDPGRDAAELDILPSIDEAKSYRRGTWASHNGGLIRSSRQTDPVSEGLVKAGWVVMVEGMNGAPTVTQGEDPREITCTVTLTSGTKAVNIFRVPMVIDLGVWREGEYQQGDHVTWDGSGWIAQRKTTAKPGMPPHDWRLSTKRGRDGKDAVEARAAPRDPLVRLK